MLVLGFFNVVMMVEDVLVVVVASDGGGVVEPAARKVEIYKANREKYLIFACSCSPHLWSCHWSSFSCLRMRQSSVPNHPPSLGC